MFSVEDRSALRDELVRAARADHRIEAAAFVGSLAAGPGDRWSDIDLALRLAPGLAPQEVIGSWTTDMYDRHGAISHFDLWSGPTLFRVFMLSSTLQVDLSLWPFDEYSANGGPFHLIFGESNPARSPAPRPTSPLIGLAWLYALHVRSSIARGRGLQALHMLNGMREQVVALACLREGVPSEQGRGADELGGQTRDRLVATIVRDLDARELVRAFAALCEALLAEISALGDDAGSLGPALRELVRTAASDAA